MWTDNRKLKKKRKDIAMENLGYKEGSAKPLRRQRVSRAASVAMCESDIVPLSAQQRYVVYLLILCYKNWSS